MPKDHISARLLYLRSNNGYGYYASDCNEESLVAVWRITSKAVWYHTICGLNEG